MSIAIWLQRVLFPPLSAEDAALTPTGPRLRRSVATQAASGEPAKRRTQPVKRPPLGNLDRGGDLALELEPTARAIVDRVGHVVERGELVMPTLPQSRLAALDLANRASVDIRELVAKIERDPLLTSEMLRIANSAMFSTHHPATTPQQAVMRIGLRSVRGVVFTASLKSSMQYQSEFVDYADETWRQAQAVAYVARSIASDLGFDPEQAYVIGLLQDIGKVALLSTLERSLSSGIPVTPPLVAQVFQAYHECVGGAVAREWKLPEELTAIIECHHDIRANTREARGAALAHLAHQIDLTLWLGDEQRWQALAESDAFALLGASEEQRMGVLMHARHAWEGIEDALARR